MITMTALRLLSTLANMGNTMVRCKKGQNDGRLHALHQTVRVHNWIVCVCLCVTSLAWPPLAYESGQEITN